jgi:hypothetical protein
MPESALPLMGAQEGQSHVEIGPVCSGRVIGLDDPVRDVKVANPGREPRTVALKRLPFQDGLTVIDDPVAPATALPSRAQR